ncbi:hypothetical protein EIN_475250, partial [Entamoeba invadens IP1]
MLPAHGYPELKKYTNLVGHFGTAWYNQQHELLNFPGPVVFTTNCLMKPKPEYAEHIFTTNEVGYAGLIHVGSNKDFKVVIEKALAMDGFQDDKKDGEVLTGFGHHALLETEITEKLVSYIKTGKIKGIY